MDVIEMEVAHKRVIVGLLEWACERIELTDSQAELAAERYNTIGHWLADGEHPLLAGATIYPQGSMRIHTTVRPVRRLEHDVDLICVLPHTGPQLGVADVHRLVGDRLREHATYRVMLERINRGWRLNYANEFHLDITPAVPDNGNGQNAILVPDRALKVWKESNPKEYATWFDAIARIQPLQASHGQRLLKADVEPLPEDISFHGALRRAVQVMKRHRDIQYLRRPDSDLCNAPISIVITTLAAHAYQHVARQAVHVDEFDLLLALVHTMRMFIDEGVDGSLWVPNPVNSRENFAEKWRVFPERYTAFVEWHTQFKSDVAALANARGIDEVKRQLAKMLGDDTATVVLKEYTHRLSANRNASGLAVAKSTAGAVSVITATAASAAIRPNTFFGSE